DAPLEPIRVVVSAAQSTVRVPLARLGVGVLELPPDIQVLVELGDVVGALASLWAGRIEADVRSRIVIVLEDDRVVMLTVPCAAVEDRGRAVPAKIIGSLEVALAAELEEVTSEDMVVAEAAIEDAAVGRDHRSGRRLIRDPAG